MRFHQVTIQILDNGAVLMQVGCKSLGFTDTYAALQELGRYYADPKGVEEEYAKRFGWPVAERLEMAPPVGNPMETAIGYSGGIRSRG